MAAILSVRLVVGKVGVVCVVASKRQLGLLFGGGRVAGKEMRRHCAQVKGEETTVGSEVNKPCPERGKFKWRKQTPRFTAGGAVQVGK